MKKKIDVEMKYNDVKKTITFYQIRGISFGIDFDRKICCALSRN